MSLHLPSASALTRAMTCNLSAVGPMAHEAPTVYSVKGDTFHDWVRAIGIGTDPAEALARIPESDPGRVICETFPLEHLPKGGNFELAVAYNVKTGLARVLGENIGRQYEQAGALRSQEFVGSIDWAGVVAEMALIIDWKTGWKHGRVADSWQLKFLAFCVAKIHGLSEARIAYVKPREDLPPIWMVETLDAFELLAIGKRLEQLHSTLRILTDWDVISGGKPSPPEMEPVEGDHCRYCPVYKRCPAKTGLAKAMVEAIAREPMFELTPEGAATAVKTLRRFEEIAKRMWAELSEYAKDHPVDLGDGKRYEWAPGTPKDSVVDPAMALDYLATEFGIDCARQAASTNKGAIENAVKSYARKNKLAIGATVDHALGALRMVKAIEKLPGKLDARIVNGKLEGGE